MSGASASSMYTYRRSLTSSVWAKLMNRLVTFQPLAIMSIVCFYTASTRSAGHPRQPLSPQPAGYASDEAPLLGGASNAVFDETADDVPLSSLRRTLLHPNSARSGAPRGSSSLTIGVPTFSSTGVQVIGGGASFTNGDEEEKAVMAPPYRRLMAKPDTGRPRFCRKCNAGKPDRSHHCSTCGVCVLKSRL